MPSRPASPSIAAVIAFLLGCGTATPPLLLSVSPCATGGWHGSSGAMFFSLALQASQDCAQRPPASAQVQGYGTVSQGAVGTPLSVTGSQQWFDLTLTLRSVDSSIVASYVGQFATRDSVLGVLTCSRGCAVTVDSTFFLHRQ